MKAFTSTRDRNPPLPDGFTPVRDADDAAPQLSASSTNVAAIRRILACVDGSEKDRCVLDYALQVALRFSSHIDVLHVQFDVHGVTAATKHEGLFDHLLAEPVERATIEAAVRARHHFREWSTRCKLPLRDCGIAARGSSMGWREIIGYETDVIATLGRVSDLIVVARAGKVPGSSRWRSKPHYSIPGARS